MDVPTAVAVTRPALLTVAEEDDEVQVAVEVRSWVLPTEYVPTTSNCCVVPSGTIGVCGLRVTESSEGASTVSVVEPLIPPAEALIVTVPCETVVTKPLLLASPLTVDTLADDELQRTDDSTCVLPLLNVPVATRSC